MTDRRPASAELFRALGVLCEAPGPGHGRVAEALGLPGEPDAAEYTQVFVFHLYPYASVYLGAEGMLGGEARDRIAGFWGALRLAPPTEPDHLAALLGLHAALLDREANEEDRAHRLLWRQARAALLHEHLLSWLPPYLDRVAALAPPVYQAWANLLSAALSEEAATLGRPETLSAHLRAVAGLPDPRRDGSQAFLSGLLAPARCGMILTRADLARAARDLGLALRAAERKFALAALLSQAAGSVLGWFAAEARTSAHRHAVHAAVMGRGAEFWVQRAAAAARLLLDLQASAVEVAAG